MYYDPPFLLDGSVAFLHRFSITHSNKVRFSRAKIGFFGRSSEVFHAFGPSVFHVVKGIGQNFGEIASVSAGLEPIFEKRSVIFSSLEASFCISWIMEGSRFDCLINSIQPIREEMGVPN